MASGIRALSSTPGRWSWNGYSFREALSAIMISLNWTTLELKLLWVFASKQTAPDR